jgi:hypothetical protein
MRISRIALASLIAFAVTGLWLSAALAEKKGPVGPPGGTIYAHDVAYRTVGTPADLPNHGKFDTIYALGAPYANVADAAPGDRDYKGGRWEVRPITWVNIGAKQFKNAEDIHAAAAAGDITIGEVIRRFECPLIRDR